MLQKNEASTQYVSVQQQAHEPLTEHRNVRKSGNWIDRHQSLIVMVLAFVIGIALVVGHHLLYAKYDRRAVDGSGLTQVWILRMGTALAFLVKTSLVTSTTIAFVQHQWLFTISNPFEVRQIDILTSILSNPLGFFQTRSWLRLPTLLLLAIVTWLLPIIAIITPATLTVVSHQDVTRRMEMPPQLYFDPNQYANLQNTQRHNYLGPQPETLRTAIGSAMTGAILRISTNSANGTYTLNFLAPALRCSFGSTALVNAAYKAYEGQLDGGGHEYHFIAWVPNGYGPNGTDALSLPVNAAYHPTTFYLDTVSSDGTHIYVIPNTSVAGPVSEGGVQRTSNLTRYGFEDILDCQLYNSSYQVLLDFSYPSQTVTVKSQSLLNPVRSNIDVFNTITSPTGTIENQNQRICYQAIMESFGRLLVGSEYWWPTTGMRITDRTSWAMLSVNWTDRTAAQRDIEVLFENITLSMLSSRYLTMNSTIAAQSKVLVDVYSEYNIYQYERENLWLTYGIAVGSTFLCILLGLFAIWCNGGFGYQNVFSTFVRTTYRSRYLQGSVEPFDNGAEPLPRGLAEVKMVLTEKYGQNRSIRGQDWR